VEIALGDIDGTAEAALALGRFLAQVVRREGVARSRPVPVLRKRFFAPEWVFIFGMAAY
jgi:hypothetical protein